MNIQSLALGELRLFTNNPFAGRVVQARSRSSLASERALSHHGGA